MPFSSDSANLSRKLAVEKQVCASNVQDEQLQRGSQHSLILHHRLARAYFVLHCFNRRFLAGLVPIITARSLVRAGV